MNLQPIIETRRLTKRFRHAKEDSVKGISLSVRRHDIFGLLGPNGAGKTTTLSILCGFFRPTSGSASIEGMDLLTRLPEIRKIVGIVPQDLALYPTLSAGENLDFYGHMYGLKGRELKLRIGYWLDKLGMAPLSRKKVSSLSGGMKRRLNLIAGILHEPRLLFLDEPTVGADVQSRKEIIDSLRELNRQGTTIIYTSHHMEEAATFCNRVAIINRGKILAEGSPGELVEAYAGTNNLEDFFLRVTGEADSLESSTD
jgi:ABC-2 type transport system ATP-binding protein